MSKRKLWALMLISPVIIFLLYVVIIIFSQWKIYNRLPLHIGLWLVGLFTIIFWAIGFIKILNSNSKLTFSIWDINRFSRDETKKRFLILFYFMMTYVWIQIVLSYFLDEKTNSQIVVSIANGISMITWIIFMIGFTNISLIVVNQKKLKYISLFNKIKYFFHFWCAYIIYLLIIIGWIILFVLPWIYRAIRFSFYPYLIIEKWYTSIRSLRESRRITKSRFRDIFSYILLLGFINVLWFLCLFIGLLWTVPMTKIAQAKMYKALSE